MLKAESGFTNNLLIYTLINFLDITPSYYCYYRLLSSADVDNNYYTPPVIYPTYGLAVNAWAYLGNRSDDLELYIFPGLKFMIIEPFTVKPRRMNPFLSDENTFYYVVLEAYPPILIIKAYLSQDW